MKKIGLLPRIVIAIVLGVLIGNVLPEGWVRVFVTFNYVFSQFLGFYRYFSEWAWQCK